MVHCDLTSANCDCYDSAMETMLERLQEEYVGVEVRNPRTHISREKALYTDYEIHVKTCNIAFSSSESCVRRRYSDFQWLRNRLMTQFMLERKLPELPPKRLFGRFKRQFLKRRQSGLQQFLEEITRESTYLSDIAVHLFLQSNLAVKQIGRKLNATDSGGELLEALESPRSSWVKGHTCYASHRNDVNLDIDSGFSYSTNSSVNEQMAPLLHKNTIERHHLTDGYSKDEQSAEESPSERKYHTYSSSSDGDNFINYDADDEIDLVLYNNNNDQPHDEDLFSFHKSYGKQYTMDQAIELMVKRPKPSERFFDPEEDSDDCFRESEYDVIDSDDEIELFFNRSEQTDNRYRLNSLKTRSLSMVDRHSTVAIALVKPPVKKVAKIKMGKVKSLPNIRFPIKNTKRRTVRRSSTFNGRKSVRLLKEVNEREELSLSTHEERRTQSKVLLRSESDCLQLTSDADYLTTIHTHELSNDCHIDTENAVPSKYYDFFKNTKKPSAKIETLISEKRGQQKGRFCISVVDTFQHGGSLDVCYKNGFLDTATGKENCLDTSIGDVKNFSTSQNQEKTSLMNLLRTYDIIE